MDQIIYIVTKGERHELMTDDPLSNLTLKDTISREIVWQITFPKDLTMNSKYVEQQQCIKTVRIKILHYIAQ